LVAKRIGRGVTGYGWERLQRPVANPVQPQKAKVSPLLAATCRWWRLQARVQSYPNAHLKYRMAIAGESPIPSGALGGGAVTVGEGEPFAPLFSVIRHVPTNG